MLNIKQLLFAIAIVFATTSLGHATEFMVLTGPLPPFSVNKGMKTTGIGVDTFEIIAKMTSIPFDRNKVRFVDWKRGFAETMALPNRVLLNVPRTPEVEGKFKWVGPVDFIEYVLVAKEQSDIQAASAKEAGKYKIGVVRGSGSCAKLMSEGVPTGSLVQGSSYIQPLMQLRSNQVQLLAASDMGVTYNMQKLRIEKEDYKVVCSLKKVPLYIAFNKNADNATVELLNKALETYKRPVPGWVSAYEQNVVKYLPHGVVE